MLANLPVRNSKFIYHSPPVCLYDLYSKLSRDAVQYTGVCGGHYHRRFIDKNRSQCEIISGDNEDSYTDIMPFLVVSKKISQNRLFWLLFLGYFYGYQLQMDCLTASEKF